MRPKRKTAGEIRFRVSKDDLKRIDVLMSFQEYDSISALIRALITNEYRKRTNGEQKISAR